MKNTITTLVIATIALMSAMPVMAQQNRAASTGGASPHETISQVFDGARNNRVTITYGRPFSIRPGTTEVRKIWGGLVPYGQPWRMGSDEATTLVTQNSLLLGTNTIPAGAYTLYMIPSETGTSQLVISTGLGGWGIPVDTRHDLTRVDLTKTALDNQVDQFTMGIDKNPSGGGIIKLSWEKTQFSVPFTIKK